MTYKGASVLILFWGISYLLGSAVAYYYMGTFARSILVIGFLVGILGFSVGHFLNRGRKQAFILALAACLASVLLMAWLISDALSLKQNFLFSDGLSNLPQNVYLLVSSTMLTSSILVLLLLLVFIKPIYHSFQNKT